MEEQEQATNTLDFQQLASIVRRRRWHFLLVFFACWLLVWSASWTVRPVYRSGTLILVEQQAVSEKFVEPNIDIDIQRQLDSITQQILSRTRLVHIIEELKLYANEKHYVNPDDLVDKMRQDIDIELAEGADRKLTSFNIYYKSTDPKLAQAVTNELANLFISQNLQDRQERSETTTKFLEDQVDQARQKLAQQEARVREFKDKHLGELPSQTAANLQILTGLQGELQGQQDSLSRAKQQNTYLESLLNQYQTMNQGETKSADGAPVGLDAIDQELDRLKAQLADLSSHYTDKHPDVRKTKEQIARTEKMRERLLADIDKSNAKVDNAGSNPKEPKSAAVLEMESQLNANRIEIASHERAIRDLEAKVSDYQARLNMAPVMEQQFADITRDYEQSKTDYDQLLAKKNQSAMATDLERTKQGEHFTMLDPPNLPTRPYKPYRLMMCGVGALLGLVMGGAVAAGPELVSGRLYSEKEIKKIAPFEILGEIPELATAAEQTAAKRQLIAVSFAAIVVMFCVLAGSALTFLRG